ncbi:MAG: TIM barrel protein [Hyphomicrobiales bacterium]|nr:TIM barrel protein [Hyphomicrobiales bacterium]
MSSKIRFSANISTMFTELPFWDRFGAAAAAGFEAVEVQYVFDKFSARDIKARASDLGLVVNHLNTAMGNPGEAGLAAQPGREREFDAVMDEALENARILDARTIHVMSGCIEPETMPAAEETFVGNMQRASAKAGGLNVLLCIEPINAVDRGDYFVSRSDDIVSLLDKIDRDNVRLLFDFYHIQIMEGDLARRMDRHWRHIGHFQFAGVPHRHEPQDCEINYPVLFADIKRRGWTGYAGAEYRPRGATNDGLGWLKDFQPA